MFKRLFLVASLVASSPAWANFTVSFHGAPWENDGASAGFYHAFLCVHTLLNSGIKDDCYGFYPANDKKAAVGGPGKIDIYDIRRVGPSIVSTKPFDITDDQRKQIFAMMKSWEAKKYQLTHSNCIDFTDSILKYLGKKTPPRQSTQTPQQYIQAVVQLNGL